MQLTRITGELTFDIIIKIKQNESSLKKEIEDAVSDAVYTAFDNYDWVDSNINIDVLCEKTDFANENDGE